MIDAVHPLVLFASQWRKFDLPIDWPVQTMVVALVGRCSEQEKNSSGIWLAYLDIFFSLFGDWVFHLTRVASTRCFLFTPEKPITNF